MAITNTVTPDALHPAFNDVIYRCTSDNSGETNFKMSVDVEVSSVVIASKFVRYVAYSEFNISSILQAQILSSDDGHDVITGSFGIQSPAAQNGALTYTLTFREWYDDTNGLLIAGDTLAVTTIGGDSIYAYNFALQDSPFDTQTFSDYDLSGASSKYLTNSVNILATGEKLYLAFIYSGALQLKVTWESYDSIGVLVNDVTSGLVTINNNRGILLIDDSPFTSSVGYVEYQIKTSAGTPISEAIRIYKNSISCPYRLEFKNLLGSMDSYSFREIESSINTSRDIKDINGVYKTLSVNPASEMVLTGKHETNDVMTWLEEMHLSSVVYLTDNTNRARVQIISSGDTTESRTPQLPIVRIKLNDPKIN